MSVNLFAVDIDLYDDSDEGLRIECQDLDSEWITRELIKKQFHTGKKRIAIRGTFNISDLVEINVQGCTFDEMTDAIFDFLNSSMINVSEEINTSGINGRHIRLNLNDISIFRK